MVGLTLAGWLGVVTIAFPSDLDLEIAFATVSGKIGDSTKTAGCIIVWATSKETQNIYCRYELEKSTLFLRDYDVGINLNDVKLYTSKNKPTFQANIKGWFGKKKLTLTPGDLSYFSEVMSRLFDPKTRHFVLDDKLDIGTNEQFAFAVHTRLIEEKIPEKVIAEFKAMQKTAQEQAKIVVEKIVAEAKTTPLKPAWLEQPIIHITIVLLYLLFILLFLWFFLATRKTTSQLRNSEVILETNINENVSTLNQEIANLKTQHKILEGRTLPERLDDMQEQLRSELEKEITQLSPVKEPRVENEPSSGDSSSDYLKKIKLLEEEKRDLENRRRSEQEEHKKELKKLQQQNQMLETYLRSSKDECEKECAQRQQVEQTLGKTKKEVQVLSHAEQTLQNVLFKRFRLIKPKEMDFTFWTTALIEQPNVWRWLQPALLGELLICEAIFNSIKTQDIKKDQDILNLLNFDSIMKHWRNFVGQLFETNDQLWVYLRDIDSSLWLTHNLRADDVLKTYFPEEKSFELLSRHLSNVNGILQAALQEMGITKILAPKLLEAVPNYVPAKKDINMLYAPNALLRALVTEKVQTRLKEMSQFVVDVQKYGFCTADNPDAAGEVQVFVSNPSEWE
jgi:hypothetical protein